METTNLTSRTWLLDALEVITNCCAIASHNQELINSYPHNNSVTEDDVKFCMEEIERSNDIRRTLMKKILDEFDANKNYWCSVKHAVARFGFSTELHYADIKDSEFFAIQQLSAESMYATISKFLKIDDVVTCGRCLNDMIEEIK